MSELILKVDGTPFTTEVEAKKAQKRQEKPTEIIEYQGGWGILPIEEDDISQIKVKEAAKKNEKKYYKVRFHEKSAENDPLDVTLCLNGDVLVFQRGVETYISEGFKEVCDNATYKKWRKSPNEKRKTFQVLRTFSYDLLGTVTESEYNKFKKEGTRKIREYIKTL